MGRFFESSTSAFFMSLPWMEGAAGAIGISNAVAPAAPSIQGSDIKNAEVDDSKNLIKFDFYGGTSFFMIMLMILIFLVVIVVMPVYCCGCSPYKQRQKRNEKKWKLELVQMIEQRNRLDAQPLQQGQLVGRGRTDI